MSIPEHIRCLDDYRRVREGFRWQCPEYFNFATDVVDRWAETHPDSHAMYWVGPDASRNITFSELSARSNQFAQALVAAGIQPGDRVLVILPRLVEWWECLLGLQKAGAIAIPGTPLLTAKDIAYRIEQAEVSAVVTDAAGVAKMNEIASVPSHVKFRICVGGAEETGWQSYESLVAHAPVDPVNISTRSDDPALIYFTSGTTGLPKMVLHTQASYGIGHQTTGRYWLDLQPGDVHWNLSDTGWAKAAWSSFFGPWICGAALFVRHSIGKFNPKAVLRGLSEYPVTTLCAPPTVYRILVQQDLTSFRPQNLRHCVAAGEPLDAASIDAWKNATGVTIHDGYGQTETVLLCANFPGVPVKPGSMGLPAPGIDLAVIDADGNTLPTGEPGEIAVRIDEEKPLGLFREYWHNEEATQRCFRNGWYLTGDCASIDEDGYFWFIGRADDIITSSAYRIGPFEVENALVEHPAVVESAVVGKPDPVRGEIVKAFIVLAEGYEPTDDLKTELQNFTKAHTAPYKYPRDIEFLEELPKTVSGKVRRVELRRRG